MKMDHLNIILDSVGHNTDDNEQSKDNNQITSTNLICDVDKPTVCESSINPISKPIETPLKALTFKSTDHLKNKMRKKSVKRTINSQWRSIVNDKRKRVVEKEEDDFEYGAPYVLLAQENENPITCYMVPQKKGTNVNQYIATASQALITSQMLSSNQRDKEITSSHSKHKFTSTIATKTVSKIGQNQNKTTNWPGVSSENPDTTVSSHEATSRADMIKKSIVSDSTKHKKLNEVQSSKQIQTTINLPQTQPVKLNQTKLCLTQVKVNTDQNVTSLNSHQVSTNDKPAISLLAQDETGASQNQATIILPPAQQNSNQIQITMFSPQIKPNISQGVLSSPQIITKSLTKVSSPLMSVSGVLGATTFPVRQVVPKVKDHRETTNSSHLLEVQKFLEEKIKALKEELEGNKNKMNEQRKNLYLIKNLQEKLKNKRRQIKTMCTQRKRLTKRLDSCKEELEKTRKALELVESQAILWNNSNMSDLGKLIFSLHTVKNKKSLDSRLAAARAPPEVKGFVISLYMTSPKAYQLVRDCFNGLPHPKTVAKWLHGERIEDADTSPLKSNEINNATLEDTFSRVIEAEEVTDVQQVNEISITETLLNEQELNIEDNSSAVYYVLDEKGCVTGQLSGSTADILFATQGFDLTSLPQHEVVIGD